MRRLILLRHASTQAARDLAFPADEPLDARGRAAAAGVLDARGRAAADVLDARGRAAAAGAALGARGDVLSSPARCCLETAAAAGLAAPAVVDALADCDYGSWRGRSIDELDDAEARAWRADPAARPHGGESLASLAARVGGWLDCQLALDGAALAVTHAAVVKAAVVHALRAPWDAFWRIDIAPLALTELHGRDGHWTVARVNVA